MHRRLKRCLNIADLRQAAKRRAHRMVFDYIDGGADDEVTLHRNSSALQEYDLNYRVLTGVEHIDTTTNLLGETLGVPFFASPAAGHRLFHTHGERGVAVAAERVNTLFCLSTLSSVSMETVAQLTSTPKWFQLYVWKDRGLVREMIHRARDAGYGALILTVDLPVHGNRERDPRNGFTIPPKIRLRQAWQALMAPAWTRDYVLQPAVSYANLSPKTAALSLQDFINDQFDPGFSWDDAEWLRSEWDGPLVIKGVVRPDDAIQAAKLGFDAVMVSNHGGRQLDHAPAPIDVLEPIVDAVGCDAEVILDGGVRRGTDVLKALALGAKAVSFARPYLYGLAAAGEAGAIHAMKIMESEVRRDMALLGVRSIKEIDRSLVTRRRAEIT